MSSRIRRTRRHRRTREPRLRTPERAKRRVREPEARPRGPVRVVGRRREPVARRAAQAEPRRAPEARRRVRAEELLRAPGERPAVEPAEVLIREPEVLHRAAQVEARRREPVVSTGGDTGWGNHAGYGRHDAGHRWRNHAAAPEGPRRVRAAAGQPLHLSPHRKRKRGGAWSSLLFFYWHIGQAGRHNPTT